MKIGNFLERSALHSVFGESASDAIFAAIETVDRDAIDNADASFAVLCPAAGHGLK